MIHTRKYEGQNSTNAEGSELKHQLDVRMGEETRRIARFLTWKSRRMVLTFFKTPEEKIGSGENNELSHVFSEFEIGVHQRRDVHWAS